MNIRTLLLPLFSLCAAGCVNQTFGVDVGQASSDYLMAGLGPETQLGIRVSPSRLRGLGTDFTLAAASNSSGLEVDVADAAAGYRLPLGPKAAFGIRGGLTAVRAQTLQAIGLGFNGGMGFVVRLSPNLAARVDYTGRQLFQRQSYGVGPSVAVKMSSVTVGVALGH